MDYILDFLALPASCLALFFIIRAKKTYFLDSRFFIGLATAGFIAYLGDAALAQGFGTSTSALADTVLVAIMATSVGFASYSVSSPEKIAGEISELRRLLRKPPPPFLAFLIAIWAWTLLGTIYEPWTSVVTNVGGSNYYHYSYESWFIGVSAVVLIAFVSLPVSAFFRQARKVNERTVSLSIRIISACWAFFGLSIFLQIAAGGLFFPTSLDVGFAIDSLLFMLISFALREPTVLSKIITPGEIVSHVVMSRSSSDMIVLYNTESDRRNLVETLVREAAASRQKMVCRVTKTEIPLYRAILKSPEIRMQSAEKGILIQPVESAASIEEDGSDLKDTFENYRELVDLDELPADLAKHVVETLTSDNRSAGLPNRRIWALNTDGAHRDILDLIISKSPGSRIVDVARQQDVFSELLRTKHSSILGQRLLLEYEPTSNYEEVVEKFVREFQTNVESVAIFTNAGSPVYRKFSEERNVRLFTLSTKTSTPSRVSNEQVLLPERDTSLFLDAVDKLFQAHVGRRIGIVFEVFTYLVLSLGFEKAYGVISSVVEMAESELATILVLINSDALESKTLNGIRGLFQSQLYFDSSGLKTVRSPLNEYEKDNLGTIGSEEQSRPRRIEA